MAVNQPRKKQSLRNNEYYSTQELFDDLYERSQHGEVFTHLMELITSEQNILLAYRAIKKNKGSKTKGVNSTTIIEMGEKRPEEFVAYVRNRLQNFHPHAVRRVEIPKPDGRMRPLGIPTMEDRIVQQCIKQVLEPICEAKFYKHSYGFRPNRSAHHAVARAMFLVNISKYRFVVDVDIKGFFDNVDHGKLLKQLWTLGIRDKRLLCVLSKMLKAPIQGEGVPRKGVPQGGILSPLLANVVLNELDWWIASQWETFPTKTNYSVETSRYGNLRRTSKMKEVFKDVLQLITNLIQNTTPSHAQSSDPFWEKSETALLQALMLYLLHEAPPSEQNFGMVMEMLESAEVREEDESYQSPLDVLFERLEEREPDSIAVKQYRVFKQAAGKTAKSILVSVGVRLAAFNLPQINRLTMTDELHLDELGEKKVALFCCIPDSDKSLNYLVGMVYTQLIQTLYRQADRVHKGRLPVPVHCLMDEFPNISLPKDSFLSALATMRSRGIFCSIIVQNISQLKAMYKDSWESLIGLCDEFLYIGGNEQSTHKYVSELIGKETVATTNHSRSRGRSGSYSTSEQQAARDLLTPDEVRLLPDGKAVLFVRGERPVIDDKYNLLRHPCIRFTEDGGGPSYDYTAAAQATDDLPGNAANWELLDMEDFLPQPVSTNPTFRTIPNKTRRRSAYEFPQSSESKPQKTTE